MQSLPNVLVLGATGLIGNAIARELVDRGYSVSCACRIRSASALNLQGLDARIITGDIDEPGYLDQLIAGQDIVVDAAAPYPLHLMFIESGGKRPSAERARARTTDLVASLHKHAAGLLYIGTSLTTDDGNEKEHPFAMQRRLMRRLHPYFSIKSTIERLLLDAREQLAGLAVVRPSAVIGPYDVKPREHCVIPRIVAGEFGITITGNLNVIDSRDLAIGVAELLKRGLGSGAAVRLTGNNTSISAILEDIAALTGKSVPRLGYPADYSVWPSYWAEWMWALVGRPSPMPSLWPILISEQGWTTTSSEQVALGVSPRALKDTLRDTIDWYRAIGYC